MPNYPKVPTDAPFDVTTIYDHRGSRLRILHHTRKKIVVQTPVGRVTLSRARLERDGYDSVNDTTFRVCHPSYALPHE